MQNNQKNKQIFIDIVTICILTLKIHVINKENVKI